MIIADHFWKTKQELENIDKKDIAKRLLNEWYFPEQNILPPCFAVGNFEFNKRPYFKNKTKWNNKWFRIDTSELIKIKYPKSLLTDRFFSIQDPKHYHDIVYRIINNWKNIVNTLFNKELKIYSYSLPIPLNRELDINGAFIISFPLRSWRLIYERIQMAEKDLISESYKYEFIARSDITNFYNSIYTHSIAWAIHWIENMQDNKKWNNFKLVWNKIDKLVQYSNKARTNWIWIWSALNDLIAEIILSTIDLNISKSLKKLDFIGTRFKDDYRFLCHSKEDANFILKTLEQELSQFNLLINETKTTVLELPNWLYREHDKEYNTYSLKNIEKIPFKKLEITILKALEIHNKFKWTSIIEKFLNELTDSNKDYKLKIKFSDREIERQISRLFSLLILMKRESEKALCYILSIIELIYLENKDQFPNLRNEIKELITTEIEKANDKKSIFQLVWYSFFSQHLDLWIDLLNKIDPKLKEDLLLKSCLTNQQHFFTNSWIQLYKQISEFNNIKLARILDIFHKREDE